MRLIVAMLLALSVSPALAQQKPDADAAIKAAFPTAPADWASRLTGDETMQQCSASHNSPAKDIASAIQKRELATVVYPPDNNFIGDWQKGDGLPQSRYGLGIIADPAAPPNTG